MLEGQSGVFIRSTFVSDQDEKLKKMKISGHEVISPRKRKSIRFKSNFAGVPETLEIMHSMVEKREGIGYVVYYRDRAMRHVGTLPPGKVFGEMSLSSENKNGTRNGTILAMSDIHCAVLNREAYLVSQ